MQDSRPVIDAGKTFFNHSYDSFTLVAGDKNHFHLAPENGTLKVIRPLYTSNGTRHTLMVAYSVSSKPCLKGKLRVNVVVYFHLTYPDYNDIFVLEDIHVRSTLQIYRPDGTIASLHYSGSYIRQVTHVHTITPGTNYANITYTFLDADDDDNPFDIDPNNGTVTKRPGVFLDFEKRKLYILRVQALQNVSRGLGLAIVRLAIMVSDVNEPPYFITPCPQAQDSCTYYLPENEPAGTVVGTLYAGDPDIAQDQVLSYFLGNKLDTLTVESLELIGHANRSFSIVTRKLLDYEDGIINFVLTIGVRDSQYSVIGVAQVYLQDLNDNFPVFTYAPPMVAVRISLGMGGAVIQYTARDDDLSDEFGEITFSISPGRGSESPLPFSIDPEQGILRLSGSLKPKSYFLIVTISNSDGLHTETSSIVFVTDVKRK